MNFYKTRRITIITMYFLLFAYVFGAEQTWTDKKIPGPFKVPAPLNEDSMASAFKSWAGTSKTPLGLECRFPNLTQHFPRKPGMIICSLDLTDMSINDSLKRMMEFLPDYKAKFDEDGMVIVRPVKTTQLDRVVEKFVLTDVSAIKALEAVRQIYEPDYIAPDRPIEPPTSGESDIIKTARENFNKRFENKRVKPFFS